MKEFNIKENVVTIDGDSREVGLTLPDEITAVQWSLESGLCLEEPLFEEVDVSKYQVYLTAHQQAVELANSALTDPTAIALGLEMEKQSAYQKEADPLFFKAQRGEATMEEWLAKVNEIKSRFE